MIKRGVAYSQVSERLVDRWLKRPRDKLSSKYWESDETKILRGEVKSYYKVEQKYECSYCRNNLRVVHSAAWDIEHIVAREARPDFMFEPRNLCIACKDCNGLKGAKNTLVNPRCRRYPLKSKGFVIIHAHFDDYDTHINRHPGGRYYIPNTEKGRITIEICGLLRFAYREHGYDPALAQAPAALKIVDEIAKTKSQIKKRALLDQMLLQAWVDMRPLNPARPHSSARQLKGKGKQRSS